MNFYQKFIRCAFEPSLWLFAAFPFCQVRLPPLKQAGGKELASGISTPEDWRSAETSRQLISAQVILHYPQRAGTQKIAINSNPVIVLLVEKSKEIV